ncbi:MAG TPA: flagellar basal body P-ring formation chaperone FlgA [Rhodoferax sp.]|nr:flagellar basal body P-ring formation chaperone FlgA [Rhodoferax sp.]
MIIQSLTLMRTLALVWLCLGELLTTSVLAQPVVVADNAAIYGDAQSWLNQEVSNTSGLPLRMEVTVGELDRRLKLAACDQIEPYLPPGTRLWGKTRLGLRCLQGSVKWNVFLPITVKAFGPAWVIKGQVASGTLLTESDVMMVEVDWAESNSPVAANLTDWLGLTATRTLTTGQTLRHDMVRAAQVFQAGAQVRVVARGAGFEIATSAQAISGGVVGQSARVRMDNGRVVSGMVLDNRTVRLDI